MKNQKVFSSLEEFNEVTARIDEERKSKEISKMINAIVGKDNINDLTFKEALKCVSVFGNQISHSTYLSQEERKYCEFVSKVSDILLGND